MNGIHRNITLGLETPTAPGRSRRAQSSRCVRGTGWKRMTLSPRSEPSEDRGVSTTGRPLSPGGERAGGGGLLWPTEGPKGRLGALEEQSACKLWPRQINHRTAACPGWQRLGLGLQRAQRPWTYSVHRPCPLPSVPATLDGRLLSPPIRMGSRRPYLSSLAIDWPWPILSYPPLPPSLAPLS